MADADRLEHGGDAAEPLGGLLALDAEEVQIANVVRRYFVPAVQMYFTGLLMVRYPDWQYLIYGVSWWAAFQGTGVILERRRDTQDASEFEGSVFASRPPEEALAEQP